MPSKLQAYCQMADHAAKQITGSSESWKAFLKTAARLYKYPYNEQVMIHAQRPDATACADYDFWNERMGRYVRRGSTGIALVDVSSDKPRLKYVFDVSDTGGREFPRRRFLWELQQEHLDSVTAMLERNYDVSGADGLALQLERVAAQLADEYWNDHQRDILGIVDDSFLEEYDEFNIGVAFRNAATVSITYSLMSRCGLDPDDYFEHEDFLSVFDFNTLPAVTALGTAVSGINQQVLRQIEATVKKYERERSLTNDRDDIQQNRGLSDSRPEAERGAGGEPRQVRQDAEEIPERASANPVEQHDSQRDTASAPAGDRTDGAQPLGTADAGAGKGGRSDGGAERQRPDAVGGADEQLQGAGGGNHPAGADLQLNLFGEPQEVEQLALFPSEAEQIEKIAQAEELSSSAFSIPQAEIDAELCRGSGYAGGKLRIYGLYQHNPTPKEAIAFLKEEYNYYGHSHTFLSGEHGFVTYSAGKGMEVDARKAGQVTVKWPAIEKRLRALIAEDKYLTEKERGQYAELARDYAGLGSVPMPIPRYGFPKPEAPAPEQSAAEGKVPSLMDDYNAVKEAHPDDIVLYQVGDFFEMFGEDARQAAKLLDIHLTTRPIAGDGRVEMCGVPAHTLERYIEKLRDKYDVTISAVDSEGGGRKVYSLPSVDHEAERAIDAGEAEFGADGARVFRDVEQLAAEEVPAAESAPPVEELTALQKKAIEIAKGYESLSMQEKVDMIARTFGYTSGKIETSPCTGKWRGTSDISIRFDNGTALFIGNERTRQAKSAKVQNEYINATLTRYNPEIVAATKEAALAPLRAREAKDNEIAAQKGLKPYTLLNVELNDGSDDNSSGYIGWYYVTLAVDGKICTHLETGLNYGIADGKVSEIPTRENYFTAGALKEDAVDYVFNNVGFSSASTLYSLPMSRDVLEHAEKTLAERRAEQPQPTIRELYERYKPVVIAAVSKDTPYRNACGNSDRENAKIECNAAVRRAVLDSHDMQLLKLFSDMPEFRRRLHQEVFEDTYPQLHEHLRPLTQDDIDDTLRAWNGDISSKRAVARYMGEHARDRDTAAWLSREYGGDEGKNLFIVRTGSPETVELPWAKVQRRIAQLIREDRFFTEQERDAQTRDYSFEYQLLDRLRTDCEYFLGAGGRDEKHLWAGNVREQIRKMRELYDMLPDKPEWLTKEDIDRYASQMAARYQVVVYHHFENGFDEKLEYQTPQEAERIARGYVDGTMEDDGFAYDGAAVYDLREKQYVRILGNFPLQESSELGIDTTAYDTESPPWGVNEGEHSPWGLVQESRELTSAVYEISTASHGGIMIREADAGKLLSPETIAAGGFEYGWHYFEEDGVAPRVMRELQDKGILETSPKISAKLEQPYKAGDTVYLEDTEFLIEEVRDGEVMLRGTAPDNSALRMEGKEAFERLLLRDTRNGAITEFLSSEPDSINGDLREVLSSGLLDDRYRAYIAGWIRSGESNTRIAQRLSEIYAGTVETIELETGDTADYRASTIGLSIELQDRFHTELAYSWTEIARNLRTMYVHELDGFAHDLTLPEPVTLEGKPTYQVGDQVTIPSHDQDISGTIGYVGETDVRVDTGPYAWSNRVINREQFDEALRHDERNAALFAPAPENFRITDDNLGVGGAKAKFRRNIEAITLLKELELDGRQATTEEQEVLSRYVGWGGLADAFDESKENWANEFKELYAILSSEEYAAARASTLNAHYTSPTVIKAIYEAVGSMGFQTGNILEPAMGVGNFFGCLPEEMRHSRLYGVELDSITGRIARQLYPQANITVAGFETTDRRDFYDLAIGNVPFGQYSVNDRAYNKLGFSIHDYFFAKALDQVRPGGIVAFVTSRYTMDKQSPEVRKYLAQRAELLGAIRLPNNAFKANAGTEVVSDIIFLQKRDRPIEIEPDWVHLGQNEDGFAINSYFIDHPEMMLGTPASESTQYGRQDFTLAPIEGADLAAQLHEAVLHISGEYREAELPELGEDEIIRDVIPADPDVKNYSYTLVNGEVYFREDSIMVRPDLNATAKERVRGMIALRDCVHALIDLQMGEYTAESSIAEKQAELNTLYDAYTAKYGIINNRGNKLAFSDDSAYYLLCSLEVLDEDGNFKRKADMFTKRTIRQQRVVTSVDTASEALAISIGERAKVDLPFMARLTGKTEDEITKELNGVIFHDPVRQEWQTADEYLSGKVRLKLRQARRAAEHDPAYQRNVEALEKAQPVDLDASEIEMRLGVDWLDKSYIQQFMVETFHTPSYLQDVVEVQHSKFTAEWHIEAKGRISSNDVAAYTTYGTERASAYDILEDSLNLRDTRIYDTVEDPDGKERRVLNAKGTTLAAQKQQAIRDAFKDWIWKDPERRQTLVAWYNENMNGTRPREYDGSHIAFSGMNPEITLREHQKNAIAHILYGGNTLLAHEVGAGKTFEMVAACMESKRLGLSNKAIIVVPNHLTEQWASEFLRLYPSANLLVTTKKDFEKSRRKKFCSRIATGDYDAVIIGHSQFERIPISKRRQENLLREQINEITVGIARLEMEGGEHFSVKQLERTRKGLEAKLERLQADHKKDDVITFEQLGVDRMFVDESDNYKNLYLYTKMRNVAGLSTSDAQKSSDMFNKCRYMDELTGGRGVVFATGTPVSNSMTELYTIQRYLQYERLQEMGMTHFDCWASRFGETTTALELAPEGTGYRARTRFAKFFNLPELMNLFKEVADIKTADQLDLPTPEVEFHTIATKPTEHQQAMVKELSERASKVHAGGVDARIDNMLKITSDGRKLGLEQRIINPLLPDEHGTKVNECVENVLKYWREGDADKLTQLVFCDISTPKVSAAKAQAMAAKAEAQAVNGGELTEAEQEVLAFTVYEDIRQKLVAAGIPPEQVAFIHDANTDARKKELFGKVRSGQVRVLLGSTEKMGAGTNVQDRLIASHDLDCPWRPRDLTQRLGRIKRQGNQNKKVHVCRYVTEGTFDAYLWQTVETKQKFISQIMSSKNPVRSCEDVDDMALNYAEIKALCAGDPRIKERMDLDIEVTKLKIMKADHQSKQYRLEDNLMKNFPAKIEENKGYIAGFQADMKTLAAHPLPEEGFIGMTVRGDTLTDKENAGAALLDACKEVKVGESMVVGEYRGLTMQVAFTMFDYELTLKGQMTYKIDLGEDPRGNIQRIENEFARIPVRLNAVENQLSNLYAQVEAAKAEVGKPFPHEEELREKTARLTALNAELDLERKDQPQTTAEATVAKSRPSVLDKLKASCVHGTSEKKKTHELEAR